MLTPAWYPLRPHSAQSSLWRCPSRFVAIKAGRGSGKTTIGLRRLVRFLPVPRGHSFTHRYAYLGPTREQAKRIAWEELKALVPTHWLNGQPSESDLCIRIAVMYATGLHKAELWVIGMDKPQRFEGKQWDGVFEDEASDQKPTIHRSVRPALSQRKGWWWKGGVPKRQGIGAKKFNEFFERGLNGNANYASFRWSSDTVLTAEEIEQAKEDLDDKDYNEQYGAEDVSASGAAFHNFDKNVHVRQVVYDPNKPIYVGSDFNVNPMAWCLAHKTPDGKGLEVFDEIWLRDTYTQHTLDVLWDRYGQVHKGGWFFHGDATAANRKTAASDSDYAQIRADERFKGNVLYPPGQPAVKDRLSSCNRLIRNAAGAVNFWVDPRCVNLINDLEYRTLDDNGYPTDAGKSATDIGHMSDGAGYLIHWYWPITRPEPKKPGQIGIFQGF